MMLLRTLLAIPRTFDTSWRVLLLVCLPWWTLLALATVGAVTLMSGCAHPREAATAAAVTAATATTVEVNHEVALVKAELQADHRARVSLCLVGAVDCIERARVESKRAMAPRVELARRVLDAHNRAIDAIEAGARCPDDPCRATQGALAAVAGAEVAALLVQLRATAPSGEP